MRNFDYIKLSEKKWDTDILNLVAKIHECKGRQDLFIRQKPTELDRLTEIAKIQSTEASNRIEGIKTTNTRMRQLFAEKTMPKNRDEDEIMGYRDVLNTIHDRHDYIPVQPAYILQLHRDLMKRAGVSYGGHFKNVQNYINETLEDGTVITRFTPDAPFETPAAIEMICDAYARASAMEEVDMLLVIPSFICDFLCIHPFNDGNGRMSRLLTLLLLYQNGYSVGKYISIEREIEKTKDRYYDVLELSDSGWHEESNDPTPFIRYMLMVVLSCYTEFEDRVGILEEKGIKSSAYDIVKKYTEQVVGAFTSREVIVNCPSIGRTATLDSLKRLVDEGAITRHGSGRGTYYVRSDAEEWFSNHIS
jgi:Fic family protein